MEKVVKAVFGMKKIKKDPFFESALSDYLMKNIVYEERLSIYEEFKNVDTKFSALMRRVLLKSILRLLATIWLLSRVYHLPIPRP